MSKSKFKKKKNQKGWLYAIFWIILIIVIGYIFYSAVERKRIEKPNKTPDNKQELKAKKIEILDQITQKEYRVSVLVKNRTQELIIARILLLMGIVALNLLYYFQIVPQTEKHGYMINHFSDFTGFCILMYSASAFLFSGSMKAFSAKIHNALFEKVFSEEERLKSALETLKLELNDIDFKLSEYAK